MSQSTPRLGVVGDGRARRILEVGPHGLSSVSIDELAERVPPDLGGVVVDVPAVGKRKSLEALRSVRAASPLIDVALWCPGASAGFVRDALKSEAFDVVLGTGSKELLGVAERLLEGKQSSPRFQQLASRRTRGARYEGMVSRSSIMWDVFELCERVAATDATVLILSETGTGKEMLARAIHRRSGRKGHFVPVNCSALPEALIEAELFGHEQGSFTGASSPKPGLVRHADGGTLFLDEVGDMPEQAQLSLLRLLQEGTVRPVGGNREVPVDVRVVAATNVHLDDAVADGAFRADLFYRLDVIRMTVPPLRERPEDIIYLLGYFMKKLCKHYSVPHPDLSQGFMDAVVQHDWPGNVRQLENFVERLVLGARRGQLTRGDFTRMLRPGAPSGEPLKAPRASARVRHVDPTQSLVDNVEPVVVEIEREYIEAVLRKYEGRVGEAAAQAGMSRRTLLRKMTAYGIDKRSYKSAS